METSTVAVEETTIYVTNAQEQRWINHLLLSPDFARHKQEMVARGWNTRYNIEISPTKVRTIAENCQVPAKTERAILDSIRRGPVSQERR